MTKTPIQTASPAHKADARPTLFVETTAQVDLILGARQVRQELERIIAAHNALSSTYVLMEFRRTAGHALSVTRQLASEAPSDEVLFPWMIRAIERGYGGKGPLLSTRQRKRCREVISMVMETLGSTPAAQAVVVSLIDAVECMVDDLTWAGISRTIDSTECDLVHPERRQGGIWPLSCNARYAQCCQPAFLADHRVSMAAALAACEADPGYDDSKLMDVLRALLTDAKPKSTGRTRCWALADLIIALEALPIGKVLSSNKKHYSPICHALGMTLLAYRA